MKYARIQNAMSLKIYGRDAVTKDVIRVLPVRYIYHMVPIM